MLKSAGLHYLFHQVAVQHNRPPMILIHGAGGNHLTWPPQIRRLAGENVYALDLPGHGGSEGAGRHSIDEYAEDVISFMESLSIPAAVLVGVSMGSAVVLTLALKYSEKIKGLVLLGGGAKMRVASSILEAVGEANTFASAVKMINTNCFSANAPQSLVKLSEKNMMKMRPSVLLGDFQACNEFDMTDQLHKINIPVLVVCGAEDAMMPMKFSKSLHEEIANSQFQVLENAGHMVMLEQPELTADLLKKFMDELPLHT